MGILPMARVPASVDSTPPTKHSRSDAVARIARRLDTWAPATLRDCLSGGVPPARGYTRHGRAAHVTAANHRRFLKPREPFYPVALFTSGGPLHAHHFPSRVDVGVGR